MWGYCGLKTSAGLLLPTNSVFLQKANDKEIRKGMKSVKTTNGDGSPYPLKVANVIVLLNVTGMVAPIFALVPIVHLLFPARMSRGLDWRFDSSLHWSLDLVLMLAWAPVDWFSPCSRPAPLPGGGGKGLSHLGRLGLGRSLRHGLHGGTAPTVAKRSPLVSG